MNVEELREFCVAKKGTTEEFPFDENTLVFKVMGKIYALISLDRLPPQCNLKCDPERAIELREEFDGAIIPGYHMNKKHWNTLFIDQLPAPLIKDLIDHSYNLIVASLTKKLQQELKALD
ncbi:MAG: MmcQ/YjbR family DNA-binding protein [Algicola sp.]|nr:MmcQ/YjbR family DNA-binding protein [Algicola sp.]